MAEFIENGIFVLLVLGVLLYVRYSYYTNTTQGVLTLKDGRTYRYTIGDGLRWYLRMGRFNGIDIELPKRLPHLYLDSMRGGGVLSSYIIDPSQRIKLEGDFSKQFQVFVPKGHYVAALSILTPDVMQTVLNQSGAYDIELYSSHLRILSRRRVSKRADRQAEVLAIASTVLTEIDHKLRSWPERNSTAAHDQDLKIYPFKGVRIGTRYFKLLFVVFEAIWLLLCGSIGALGGTFVGNGHVFEGLVLLGAAVAIFVVLTVLTFLGVEQHSFRSHRD